MSLNDLSDLGQFISSIAVLGSLIYVAIQIRQTERNQRAVIHQGRATQATDRFGAVAADPVLTDILVRAQAGDATLEDTDINRYIFVMIAGLTNFEDQFFQHRERLLTDDDFEGTVLGVKAIVVNPGFRAAWQLLKGRLAKPFQDFIEAQMAAAPPMAAPAVPALWRKLAAQEVAKIPAPPPSSQS